MPSCVRCGKVISLDANFCCYCGMKQPDTHRKILLETTISALADFDEKRLSIRTFDIPDAC